MQNESIISQRNLQLSLYSGVALIVISILFLGREQESMTFITRIVSAVTIPALFYLLGGLVIRYLKAPLAGPGIVATGGWLIVVGLIHLWDQSDMPAFMRPYYWLIASLAGAVVITLTAHYLRTWLLIPLIPLVQANALWAGFDAVGLNVVWWSALTFLLVLVWWELPQRFISEDDTWKLIYQVCGVLMTLFLLGFAYWLPAPTDKTMLSTWSAGALLVTYLGMRHRVSSLIPLALAMLTGAVMWGLPAMWWSVAWLVIALGTVIFIEQLARKDKAANAMALDLSIALSLILTGMAALFTQLLPLSGADTIPSLSIPVLLISAGLFGWIGWRGAISKAV
ncbi:MAG TPA: hypothetical protein VJZ27_12405, partial [Aggregatilineales bacterium]|nr:hypothetical protein [Aggregatilineales bacterium]